MNSNFFEQMDGIVVSYHAVHTHRKATTAGCQSGEENSSARAVRVVREIVDQEIPDDDEIDGGQRAATALAIASQRSRSTALVQSPSIFIQLPTMNPWAWG